MVHGISQSSFIWIINSADLAPAFILAREGYDVWLGNNRGNGFSRDHTTLSNKTAEYWEEVDFEQMGTLDVPAFVNKILEQNTKHESLAAYFGHSEGTTQFFIGSSMLPDFYKEKINIFIAFAPVVSVSNAGPSALKNEALVRTAFAVV